MKTEITYEHGWKITKHAELTPEPYGFQWIAYRENKYFIIMIECRNGFRKTLISKDYRRNGVSETVHRKNLSIEEMDEIYTKHVEVEQELYEGNEKHYSKRPFETF